MNPICRSQLFYQTRRMLWTRDCRRCQQCGNHQSAGNFGRTTHCLRTAGFRRCSTGQDRSKYGDRYGWCRRCAIYLQRKKCQNGHMTTVYHDTGKWDNKMPHALLPAVWIPDLPQQGVRNAKLRWALSGVPRRQLPWVRTEPMMIRTGRWEGCSRPSGWKRCRSR